ncbi:hypothetical protein KY339_05555 [Candidatus Woesearchaeota archaeon]|nr:hypothetical protein [Candidatus Woesearchaeota archaeon]
MERDEILGFMARYYIKKARSLVDGGVNKNVPMYIGMSNACYAMLKDSHIQKLLEDLLVNCGIARSEIREINKQCSVHLNELVDYLKKMEQNGERVDESVLGEILSGVDPIYKYDS